MFAGAVATILITGIPSVVTGNALGSRGAKDLFGGAWPHWPILP